jgi:glycosyltransferase involved in cell wall biosynthesis
MNTGHGIDRYSFELSKRINREHRLRVLSQGELPNAVYWALKELIFPIKALPFHADVYHAVSQQNAKVAILTVKRPLVTTIHDLIAFKNSLTTFYQGAISGFSPQLEYMRLCTLIAVRSDLIIAPFEVTRRDLTSILKVSDKKIRLISYGVDNGLFKPLKLSDSQISKKGGKKVVFFVGGFSVKKGVDTLMKAFSLLSKKEKNIELWICGKWNFFDGAYLAKELGIVDSVKVLGHVPESLLPLYYNLADLIVLPYRIGFSLPVLEAMACGKAVITSDTPDLQEIVGGSVEMVSPIDVTKLAASMDYLLSDASVRVELGQRAYERAQLLSWDIVARKTMDVYLELYSGS